MFDCIFIYDDSINMKTDACIDNLNNCLLQYATDTSTK